MTFIDANVILDFLTDDPNWARWSLSQLDRAAVDGPLLINDVVYAEVSIEYDRIEELDRMVVDVGFTVDPIPRAALFLAGKAFKRYRTSGGTRTGVLPDFFIGAHAAVIGVPLLTRDTRRYRRYFPNVALISPEG